MVGVERVERLTLFHWKIFSVSLILICSGIVFWNDWHVTPFAWSVTQKLLELRCFSWNRTIYLFRWFRGLKTDSYRVRKRRFLTWYDKAVFFRYHYAWGQGYARRFWGVVDILEPIWAAFPQASGRCSVAFPSTVAFCFISHVVIQ